MIINCLRAFALELRAIAHDFGAVAHDLGALARDLGVAAPKLRAIALKPRAEALNPGALALKLRADARDPGALTHARLASGRLAQPNRLTNLSVCDATGDWERDLADLKRTSLKTIFYRGDREGRPYIQTF